MDTYKVLKIERYTKVKTVLKSGLSEIDAQNIVKDDIKINPNAETYMIIYTKE